MRNFQDTLDVRDWDAAGVVLENFSAPEEGFVWQTGRWGEITFDFDDLGRSRASAADLMIDLDVFKHGNTLTGQNVFVYLNGLRIGSFFVTGRRIAIMNFPVGTLRPKHNVLTLDTPDAAPPRTFGMDDGRVLGASIYSIYFRREN